MNGPLRLYYNQATTKRLRRKHVVRWMLTRIDARRGYTTRVTAGKHGNIMFYDVWFGE